MMRTTYVIAVIACACGSSSKAIAPRAAPPAPPSNHVDPAAADDSSAQKMCRKLDTLHAAHCPKFEDFLVGPSCPDEYAEAAKQPDMAPTALLLEGCLGQLDSCADVTACIDAAQDEPLRACDDKTIGQAVGVPRARWLRDTMRHAVKFSQIHTTKAEPVEVCGIGTENEWLTALQCDNGSLPFREASPETARSGSVGPGGHCRSIIDLYRVPCPEATYDIYLDGYVCPLPP
jgi:hypothetical protein